MKVGFQGIEGAFSHHSAIEYFGENVHMIGYESFQKVFEALNNDEVDEIIVPIENASTGSIFDVYDLLKKYDFYIVGEQIIYINQCLLGIPGTKIEDIDCVFSHTQGLQQSSKFLSQYPKIFQIPYKDTSLSAKKVSLEQKKNQASISSSLAAKIFHLDIIAENIQNMKDNQTRFVVLSKKKKMDGEKVSVMFHLDNRQGQLSRILSVFNQYHYDIAKIECRPNIDQPWQYTFFIDAINKDNDCLKLFIEKLKEVTIDLRFLGIYLCKKEGKNNEK